MPVRNGGAYRAGLGAHPRDVWIAGRRVEDVTTDPVFRRPIEHMALLYDLQTSPEWQGLMTFAGDDAGGTAGTSFMIPRTREDLAKRRESMAVWADATFGMVGR